MCPVRAGAGRVTMAGPVDFQEARQGMAARKGFRNWKSRFGEDFGPGTRLQDISVNTLRVLAQGKQESTFYLLELIMNVRSLGSGLEFHGLSPEDKLDVMDRNLFLLDRIRFEWMRRLGWLESYPGEKHTLVELARGDERLLEDLKGRAPALSKLHPGYPEFQSMSGSGREEYIRKLIPRALKEIGG